MKLSKTASGKTTVKLSKTEWTNLGKKAGWFKKAGASREDILRIAPKLEKYPQFLETAMQCPDSEEVAKILRGEYGDTEKQLCQIHMKCCNNCQNNQ